MGEDDGGTQRERWSARTHPKRFVIVLVVVVAICLVIGAGLGRLSNAWGTPPDTPATHPTAPGEAMSPEGSQPMAKAITKCVYAGNTTCNKVTKKNRKSARKFRKGKIHHAKGFTAKKLFKKPKRARRWYVKRITRVLKKHKKQTGESAADVTASMKMPAADPGCSDRCEAYRIYGRLLRHAGCVDKGVPYPVDPHTCKYPETKPLTRKQVQAGGAAILCGGLVAIGAVTSTATGGTTAVVAFTGAAACGWAFWMNLD